MESKAIARQCRLFVLPCVSYWITPGALAWGRVFSNCVVVTRAWIQARKQTETPSDMSLETQRNTYIIYFLCPQKLLQFLKSSTWAPFFKPEDVFMSALFCFKMTVSFSCLIIGKWRSEKLIMRLNLLLNLSYSIWSTHRMGVWECSTGQWAKAICSALLLGKPESDLGNWTPDISPSPCRSTSFSYGSHTARPKVKL